MQAFIQKSTRLANKLGLTPNRGETKVMIVARAGHLPVSNSLQDYEKVRRFTYVGSVVDNNASSSAEIQRRICLTREATTKLTRIWRDRPITPNTKLKTLVFPVFLYP